MAAFKAASLFGLLLGSVLALCACFPGANGRWRAEPFELAAAQHKSHQLHRQHLQNQQHQQGTNWRPTNLGRQLAPPTHKHKLAQQQPTMWRQQQSGARRNHHVNDNYHHRELLRSPGWPSSRLASTYGERRHHRASVSALAAATSAATLSNKDNFVDLGPPLEVSEQVETILQSHLKEEPTLPMAAEVEAIGLSEGPSGDSRRQVVGKYKRQALDLAVNRLHILEDFDEQLREFANSAQQQTGQQSSPSNSSSSSSAGDDDDDDDDNKNSDFWRQELCVLTLADFPAGRGRRGHEGGAARNNNLRELQQQQHSCLASERLRRHVPPYMLNLHSQLLSESRTLADAVRLMPYQSLVMRSFRQPPLAALSHNSSAAFASSSSSPEAANGAAAAESGFAGSTSDSRPADAPANAAGFQMLSKSTSATTRADANDAGGEEANYYGDQARGADQQRAPVVVEHNAKELSEASIVVELSALGPAPSSEEDQEEEEAQLEEHKVALGGDDDQAISGNVANRNSDEEEQPSGLNSQRGQDKATSRRRLNRLQHRQLDALNGVERPELAACNLAQRAEPAHERSQLCYWFQLGEQLRLKINGSLVRSRHSSAWKRERLLEAELHVFKLLPEMFDESAALVAASAAGAGAGAGVGGQVATHWIAQQQHRPQQAAPTQPEKAGAGHWQHQTRRSNLSRSSWQHLKTNLLEVSLYQILPKKNSSYLRQRTAAAAEVAAPAESADAAAADFPLRLLDIRRIDLHSAGWETFYVKRAVEDWLRDASLNLGLVIKAKSMFGEPVRIGLIRFADLYDHPKQQQHHQDHDQQQHHQHHHRHGQQNSHARRTSEQPAHHIRQREQQQQRFDGHQTKQPPANQTPENQFDLDHQPILVIYTTTVH